MNQKLSSIERNELIIQHKKTRDKRVCDRIKAVLAYDDGYSYPEIAKILLLNESTIRRHISDYFVEKKLAPENGGSKSFLCAEQEHQLIAHLNEFTYLRVKDICAYVYQTFGIAYSVGGMTHWLHTHRFTYKKPQSVPAKANAVAQQKFVESYQALKQDIKQEPLYFADAVHPQHQPRLSYGWILKGTLKQIPMNGQQKRVHIIGGLKLSDHRIIYTEADTVNGSALVAFLKHLRKHHPKSEKIHVVWDNAGYHKSADVVNMAEALNIKLHYLPPYSPNLNPIERLWKIMHEYVTYNTYYETFKDFKAAILTFFKTIGRKKRLLRARINDKFSLLQSPLLAS